MGDQQSFGEDLLRLCAADDVIKDEPLRVVIDGHEPFCVYRVEDRYFVTADTCTHGQASLADEGYLEGFVITCTWHDGKFDIRNGEAVAAPCWEALRTFAVTVRDGDVLIAIEPAGQAEPKEPQ